MELLNKIDIDLFLWLNSMHTAWLDVVMYYVSTRWLWIPLYVFLAVYIWRKHHTRALLYILLTVLLILLSDQLSVFFKNYFLRLRPCHNPDLAAVIHLVNGKCGGMYGFVSSHAANAFALAAYVIMIARKDQNNLRWVMLAYACLVSYSRIYLGVHYPADVIGGALLGSLIGYVVFTLADQLACRNCLSNPFNFGK